MTERIHLPVRMSEEDRNKIVNKAEKMGLPADQLLGHIAPEEVAGVNYLNKIAMIAAAVVIFVIGTGWFATFTKLKALTTVRVEEESTGLKQVTAGVFAKTSPHLRDEAGRSWIGLACQHGDLAEVKRWLSRGTDPNQPRHSGKWINGVFTRSEDESCTGPSPLIVAARLGHFHIIEYFLDREIVHGTKMIDWNYQTMSVRSLYATLLDLRQGNQRDDPKLLRCIEKFQLL